MIKIISILIFTFLFSVLTYFNNTLRTRNDYLGNPLLLGAYQDGLLKDELELLEDVSNYNIEVFLNHKYNEIYIKENILWVNNSKFSLDTLYFNLSANAFKSKNSFFCATHDVPYECYTSIDLKKFLINGKDSKLYYPDINETISDSTRAFALLNNTLKMRDTILINFEYKIKIPLSYKSFGYASGRNFYFFSQWFPKVAVFQEGVWECEPYYPYTDFYSDFSEYNVKIITDSKIKIFASGNKIEEIKQDSLIQHNFKQKGIHDFVWVATDEILEFTDVFDRQDGSKLNIHLLLQPEKEKFRERYLEVVKNSLTFLEKNIGKYPYSNFTLVDLPKTFMGGSKEYPTLITIKSKLFSPIGTLIPEYEVAKGIAHQYFYGMVASNQVHHAWMDEGISSYVAGKIISENYEKGKLSFDVNGYFPVFGLNFLSLFEIPLVYTMGNFYFDIEDTYLENYIENHLLGSIVDKSFTLPNYESYQVNSSDKPVLILNTLERYIGEEKVLKILNNYFNEFKFKKPKPTDLFNIILNEDDLTWFIDNFYNTNKNFDYQIPEINKKSENTYEVFAINKGSGFFKCDVVLYTDKDTLFQTWNDNDRWKKFTFITENNVLGAEIDPFRKNLLDLNYANNSLLINSQYGAGIVLAIRWFFWMQNLLIVLGSVG